MEPGSDGGPNVNTRALATPETGPCRLPSICFCERLRSPHCFRIMPEKDDCGSGKPLMVNRWSFSGTESKTLPSWRVACSR